MSQECERTYQQLAVQNSDVCYRLNFDQQEDISLCNIISRSQSNELKDVETQARMKDIANKIYPTQRKFHASYAG